MVARKRLKGEGKIGGFAYALALWGLAEGFVFLAAALEYYPPL